MTLLILAGSRAEAAGFALSKNLTPLGWKFICDYNQVRGLYRGQFVRYGSWRNLPEIDEILMMLYLRGFEEVNIDSLQ